MAQGFITIGKPAPKPMDQHMAGKHDAAFTQEDISSDIVNLSRRVRILEERNTNMQNRMEIIEQNMLSRHKHVTTELKTMLFELSELNKEVNELKNKMLLFVKELQMTAKKEEIGILKKYIDLWEPVNFVTHGEVEDLVQQAVQKQKSAESTNRNL